MDKQAKKWMLATLASCLLLESTLGLVIQHGTKSQVEEERNSRPHGPIRRSYFEGNHKVGGSEGVHFDGEVYRVGFSPYSYGAYDGGLKHEAVYSRGPVERISAPKYSLASEEDFRRETTNFGPVSNGNDYNGFLSSRQGGLYSGSSEQDGGSRASHEEAVYGGHANKKENSNFGGYFNAREGASYGGWSTGKDSGYKGGQSGGKGWQSSYGKGSGVSSGTGGWSSGSTSGPSGYSSGPTHKASATSYISGLGSSYGGGSSQGLNLNSHDSGYKGGESKYSQATFIASKGDKVEHGHHGHDDGHDEGHDHHNDGYEFEYFVHDPHTHDFKSQKEHSDGHVVKGQYTIVQPDGMLRTVDYTADWKHGFQAKVHYSPAPKVNDHDEHAYSAANFNLFNKGHH